MNYRPICDTWYLARAKLLGGRKYYGAYLGGFPERARVLVGAGINDPVLHVCGGMARFYPYRGGFGTNDKTLDLAMEVCPDYLQDAIDPYPTGFRAMICDPPYSPEDAAHYAVGSEAYPSPNAILKRALEALPIGGRVGILHYFPPTCPKNAKYVAQVSIYSGFNNRVRSFAVYERTS